jgi:hypothetical protein
MLYSGPEGPHYISPFVKGDTRGFYIAEEIPPTPFHKGGEKGMTSQRGIQGDAIIKGARKK